MPIVLKNSVSGSVWVINHAAGSEREEEQQAGRWLGGWDWDQLCELSEVLGGGGEQELGSSAAGTA
jgi:hypothetical protein